jgi:XTP/dITP diphosphohydrolase
VQELLIASNNLGKVKEFRELLADCGWQIVSPAEVSVFLDVEEDAPSYLQNALLKASAFAEKSGLAALADDSGLEVDALYGEPGVHHHLNGWDGADQAERIAILLKALHHVPASQRGARFRCSIVVANQGAVLTAEGACEGVIIDQPRGTNGHGYDPVFYLPELGATMAELTIEQKNRISHRGRAAEKMRSLLQSLAGPY